MIPRAPLSRRALLRGAGGVAIALPFLEAMTPRRARGAAMAQAPRRMLNFFTENGVVEGNWYPTGTEKQFTLPVSTLAIACPPFEPGYQAWTIAGTRAAQGIATPSFVSSTTAVLGFAAATAEMRAS